MASKEGAYLGFARRAGKLPLGVNAVRAVRGRVYLLVADGSASQNTKKEIGSLQRKFSCPLAFVEGLGSLVGKENCKVAAVREAHLAQAILRELEKDGGSVGKE